MATATVIVCTRNRPEELARSLDAISKQNQSPDEVIVVDSASKDDRAREITQQAGYRYLFEGLPGLSRARNRGFREASGSLIAFLDDDAIPAPDWLFHVVKQFSQDEIGAVSGRVSPLALQTETEILFQEYGGFSPNFQEPKCFDDTVKNWFELANFGGMGSGANLTFRKEALDKIKGFDERLGQGTALGGYEDYDAISRLISNGYKVVYTPYAIVKHPYPRTIDELRERYLHGVKASGAYTAMLLSEKKGHRIDTLRCIWKAITGRLRVWSVPGIKRPQDVSVWSVYAKRLSGVLLYYRHR